MGFMGSWDRAESLSGKNFPRYDMLIGGNCLVPQGGSFVYGLAVEECQEL